MPENAEICKKCGGECCYNTPGYCHPSELGKDFEGELRKRLESGKYKIFRSFATLDGERVKAYRLIPNTLKISIFGLPGPCVFLTENGCELPYEKRPMGCRMLIPIHPPETDSCYYEDICFFENLKNDWLPFQEIVERVEKAISIPVK